MKRSISDRPKPRQEKESGIHWDEANLEENDKIKAELKPTKINEPKTPYHGPSLSEDDELDELDIAEASGMPPTCQDQADAVDGSLQECARGGPAGGDEASCLPPEESAFVGQQARRAKVSEDAESLQRISDDGSLREDKRQRFLGHRKEHYDMRTALQRGKELVAREMVDEAQLGNGSLQTAEEEEGS
ncbi:hypothetical protein WJX72_011015 [[Myrmecia] bisecta]|uniref:Protein phosphatase inhibitor 2 n=1 Tax=[Myrmecia] bisecta TaxID=41462 RepID=A0AAW1PMH9_9CHLO